MLLKFNKKCSSLPKGIPNEKIDKCLNTIPKFLFFLFNEIISHQKIPKRLKISEIIATKS
jgi:hypothetical protein